MVRTKRLWDVCGITPSLPKKPFWPLRGISAWASMKSSFYIQKWIHGFRIPDIALTSRPDGSEPSQKTELEFLVDLLKEHRTNPTKFLKKLKKIGFKEFEHTPFGTVCNSKDGRLWFFAGSSPAEISQAKYKKGAGEKLIYFKNLK